MSSLLQPRLLPRLLDHTPNFLRTLALAQLFRATAAAFQAEMPRLSGLSHEQRLLAYARFTTDRAEEALRNGEDVSELLERLYGNAYRLGRIPGRLLRVQGVDDVMTLGRLLYGILNIDFHADGGGEITIRTCYFSSHYSPQVCQLMSAMDCGLLAGLAGDGKLEFTQRITEGHACCRANFTLERVR
jgi:hypothetical protein